MLSYWLHLVAGRMGALGMFAIKNSRRHRTKNKLLDPGDVMGSQRLRLDADRMGAYVGSHCVLHQRRSGRKVKRVLGMLAVKCSHSQLRRCRIESKPPASWVRDAMLPASAGDEWCKLKDGS